MANHIQRIEEHMKIETEALLLEARRARLLDHNGNRGSEAEHSILRWLRARLAPEYSICSGEIIDSFDTSADLPSRQQDGIVFRNCAEANRFLLPSGMRLVPIETVAAVVEVKLSLDAAEFKSADDVAEETTKLRLRGNMMSRVLKSGARGHCEEFTTIMSDDWSVSVDDPTMGFIRPVFAVLGFTGVKEVETLARWLKSASHVSLVGCLEAGVALRQGDCASVSAADSSLVRFAECIRAAVLRHDHGWDHFRADFSGYHRSEVVRHWDETGFAHPTSYCPEDWEAEALARFMAKRGAEK